ncbi:Predicted Zn-dependent peptidase [Alkalithermobacter thermoalcaliphilus JW-YL-7 = DSM 7308]|uniref:Peptidase M16 domain protein n=1 Tax=Alkalithermobacter thermoalcaliphilus JW-YL-7 = DSM 7308 TaxID=1121328 RepID=A0A150FPJ2_CLOPD|nr:peptidase M16 domain protein [[Clostridium] paradoxum JW-YL-7 = DSM 7308]SHK98915.1 Predicted Zn-dependent peptidase [[Clostridium] paradoxum JW-YL-7 = DSM 7308]
MVLINTEKFKTNLISVYIKRPLDRKEVTKNTLIPSLLESGTVNFKTQREISRKLDELYGAGLACSVSKKGEKHILSFKLAIVNNTYVNENILKEGLILLNEIINKPLVENNGFKKEYLEIEKSNLRDKIRSRINDKGHYALERCIEEMCKGESFSIYEYGYEEDLKDIDEKTLYDHYKHIIRTSPIDIVIAGSFDRESIINDVKNILNFERDSIIQIPQEQIDIDVKDVKNITEKMDVTQGKIVLGFRTNIHYKDDKYYPLMVYSNILGGGPHSKLFVNVREKESLCYYIYSSIEKYKSIMVIASGIEVDNYEKAINLINEQLEKINKGEITQEEISNSKKALINSVNSVKDSLLGLSDFYYGQIISQTQESLDSIIEKINSVTIEQVIDASSKIKLDTIYFLRN